jgi:hypothetical protein
MEVLGHIWYLGSMQSLVQINPGDGHDLALIHVVICGLRADVRCNKCHSVYYCSRTVKYMVEYSQARLFARVK